MSPGPLAEAHSELTGITQCKACHEPGAGVSPNRCMACHEIVREQVATGEGFHGDLGRECSSCHPDHRGREFDMVHLVEEDFDHDKTRFPLRGSHEGIACVDCHTDTDSWRGLSEACAECHDDPHNADASGRDLVTCERCHGVVDWDALPLPVDVFDHDVEAFADYPLEGEHAGVACEECHDDWHFVPVESGDCVDCHDDPHRADLGEPCSSCHETPQSWEVVGFDHDLTGYSLLGEHVKVSCDGCHGEDRTEPVAHGQCASCHRDIHDGQFAPRVCEDCHTVDVADFALRDYDHDQTDYPLRGGHVDVPCEDCHGDGELAQYAQLPFADCDDCHDDVHEGQFEPSACSDCHVVEAWDVADFDHDRTDYPLTGAHVDVACEDCHVDDQWSGIAYGTCLDCHADDNPHGTDLTADSCTDCHVTSAWETVAYDHAGQTEFDLEPQHGTLACGACHEGIESFDGLEMGCVSCHEEERPFGHYAGDCDTCHFAADWLPGSLGGEAHAVTGFALTGVHLALPCEGCHPPAPPQGTARSGCADCHAADDVHRGQLGATCDDCHDATSWLRTRFRHHQTGWPLRGAHRLAHCSECHALSYVGTPTDCAVCHEAEAPRGLPSHQTLYFPFCDSCHRPYTWLVPEFAH